MNNMKNEAKKLEDSEKPEEIIDEIVASLDRLHEKSVENSVNIGYARDRMQAVRPVWEQLGNMSTTDPEASGLYESNYLYLQAFRDEVRSTEKMAIPLMGLLNNTSGSSSSFVSASGTTSVFFGNVIEYFAPDFPLLPTPNQYEFYKKRFSVFDDALGNTYQEIWEVLYGTRADPERAALYLIRHAFDQLFGKLAPDDDVRQSPYWKKKDGLEPDLIWRDERIQFAAAIRIKDKARAVTLLKSSKHMLNAYQALNRAHERGNLNRVKARTALEEMRTFLEDWANAVGL